MLGKILFLLKSTSWRPEFITSLSDLQSTKSKTESKLNKPDPRMMQIHLVQNSTSTRLKKIPTYSLVSFSHVESCDLSSADKSIIRVSSLPKLSLNDKIYSYTKKNYLALGNLAKLMFWPIVSFKNWKVNTYFVSTRNQISNWQS